MSIIISGIKTFYRQLLMNNLLLVLVLCEVDIELSVDEGFKLRVGEMSE